MNNITSILGPQHDVPTEVDPLLVTILSWPRPHASAAELRFRAWLAAQIKDRASGALVQYLGAGSLFVEVPGPKGVVSTTMFCSHVDTVDAQVCGVEADAVKKKLTYDPNFGLIGLDSATPNGTCLGADDGVGVWLMLEMIKAKCPGGYMFHTGEECGGIGSSANVREHRSVLSRFKLAIAFDRPGNDEVITHQRAGTECASTTCGSTLAARLNKHGFQFKTSSRGVFTDTANYRSIIPECFNLGVGYEDQHGRNETLDYNHAFALVNALCSVDWASLPIVRDPTKPDPQPAKWSSKDLWGDHANYYEPPPVFKKPKKKAAAAASPVYENPLSSFDDAMMTTREDMLFLCDSDPDVVADMMRDLTVEVARLRAEVMVLRSMK